MSDDETNLPETNPVETNPTETNSPAADQAAVNVATSEAQPVVEASEAQPVPQAPVVPPPLPVVLFHSVTARDVAGPRRRTRGTLNGVSFSLGTGVFAFVGAPEDGTIALVDVLTGARAPVRGNVQVLGTSPERSSRLRSRMGVLSPEPVLPAAGSVEDVVRTALSARGQTQIQPANVLESLGLDYLASRHPQSLSFAETRAVELALALSTPSPVLVVLHEPLADVAVNLLGLVRERIHQVGASGACVVVTTSSPADARALADEVFVLHRGAVMREVAATSALPRGAPLLVAWVRPAQQTEGLAPIRLLAQALAAHPEVSSVTWSDQGPSASPAAELRLSGNDIDACALALADAATEVGAIIEAITPASPGLTRLRAAAEAADAMRRAAFQSRPLSANDPARGGKR